MRRATASSRRADVASLAVRRPVVAGAAIAEPAWRRPFERKSLCLCKCWCLPRRLAVASGEAAFLRTAAAALVATAALAIASTSTDRTR